MDSDVLISSFIFMWSVHSCFGHDFLSVVGKNISLNGEKVFLSGVNQPWYKYGADFGLAFYSRSKGKLMQTLNGIQANGGNSVRIWVHAGGFNTPMFNETGFVVGLDPKITRDMIDFVREAQKRNILVTFTLWNCAILNKGVPLTWLLMDETKLDSYLQNALVPMVTELKSERGLGIWEIINEPEGCIVPGISDKTEPCYDTSTLHFWDFSGWTKERVPLKRMLRFISKISHTIHDADPKALVTVGSWTYKSVTDQLDRRNFYSDHCLLYASGGLPSAKLDLYQIHTYDFLSTYFPDDPFLVDADIYKFDKPVIIGEFSQKRGGHLTIEQQFHWAYYHGYSGAWSWSAIDSDDASDTFAVQEKGMLSLKDKDDQQHGGRVNINLNSYMVILLFTYIWESIRDFISMSF